MTLLLLSGLGLYGDSITISLVRTTMPESTWNAMTENVEEYKNMVNTYGTEYEFSYSVNATSDSIDFVYTFESGWHWGFYQTWRDEALKQMNDAITQGGNDPGYRWDISVSGEIDPDNNPWKEVSWLQDVSVHDGSYLAARGLGWLYAPGWNTEGRFWAWAYNVKAWNWIYFWGHGFYYDRGSEQYFYNWPGTSWAYNYETNAWVDLSD